MDGAIIACMLSGESWHSVMTVCSSYILNLKGKSYEKVGCGITNKRYVKRL